VGGEVLGGGFGEDFNKKVDLQVIAEKMKIYSYIRVGKIHMHRMFPKGWTNSKGLHSGIYLIWHPHDWKGAVLLNVPFIKQHLY
jgi:hypothetical protein